MILNSPDQFHDAPGNHGDHESREEKSDHESDEEVGIVGVHDAILPHPMGIGSFHGFRFVETPKPPALHMPNWFWRDWLERYEDEDA